MTNIRELPNELKFVVNLKFLKLEYARFLHSIPGQVISSFTMLQVLKMFGCGRSSSDHEPHQKIEFYLKAVNF